MRWLEPSAALLGMGLASVALLRARRCPWIIAFACWAVLSLCVAMSLLPVTGAVLLAAAVVAAVGSRRLGAGLSWALFAWLVSVAAGWTLIKAAGVSGVVAQGVLCSGRRAWLRGG